MENYEEYLVFAKDIAKNAGSIMLKYFNQNNGASYKGDKTIVTLADTEINTYLIQKVKEKYPEHCVDGEPIIGVVYDPFTDSLYTAIKGKGAYKNNEIIYVNDYSLTIFTGTEHKHCDIAAVKVIVEEAEGKVTDIFGNGQRYDQSINGALISNGIVHNEAVDVIKKYIVEE